MYTRSNSEKKCNFIGGAKMEQRALINWSVKLKEKKKKRENEREELEERINLAGIDEMIRSNLPSAQ